MYAGSAMAHEKTQQTLKFAISGDVEKASVITLDSLKQYKIVEIGDKNVTDHTGAFKHKDDKLKGILLKDVLSHTKFKTTSPKLLSRFYFVVHQLPKAYSTAIVDLVHGI